MHFLWFATAHFIVRFEQLYKAYVNDESSPDMGKQFFCVSRSILKYLQGKDENLKNRSLAFSILLKLRKKLLNADVHLLS